MEIEDFKEYTAGCFQGTDAPCMAVCPLKVDVRSVIDKVQKGNFSAAYRAYRNQVLFPGIVSTICDQPCREVCVRRRVDKAIEMRGIERACVEFTTDRAPIKLNVPAKNRSIAIVGAGLSGLACALKLAARKYDVTVYEKRAAPGGSLAGTVPEEFYLAEFQNEFKHVSYKLVTSREIVELDEIEADAVYVATGAGGKTFGLREEMDRNSLGTRVPGVFLGGSVLGANPVEAIEHGVRVSNSIEKYLKVGLMDGVPETYLKSPVEEKYYKLPVAAGEFPEAVPTEMSRERAVAESGRCLKCDCSLCGSSCDLMKKFKKTPKRIIQDVMTSLRPVEQFSKRVASRLINTCNQCGLCATVCPEKIDLEDCLLRARRFLHRDGALPAAYHDFWMRDMEFAESEAAGAFIAPETGGPCRYLYFPGCQLGASESNYVLKSYAFLKEVDDSTALLLGCCGVPADWAGNEPLRESVHEKILRQWQALGEPTMVAACPTCMKTFSRYLPQIKIVPLYDILARHVRPEWQGKGDGKTISVFDPCSSRYNERMQASVRGLLTGAGYRVEELPHGGTDARCCSYGGHIQAVNRAQVRIITTDRIRESPNPYVTYCSNCRDVFASAGKPCSHILDVLFDTGTPERPAPDLSQRRRNRVALVQELRGEGSAEKGECDPMESIILEIPPELRERMNQYLVLEEDVVAVIEHCEATGHLVRNGSTGELTGHLCRGAVTYWATFEKVDSRYRLKKVYTHRMKIEETVK